MYYSSENGIFYLYDKESKHYKLLLVLRLYQVVTYLMRLWKV